MGKLEQWQQGRNEGMDYALRIARKDGVEGLESEVKRRGITGISANVSHREMQEASVSMRNMMFDTFLVMTIGVLHDRFDFDAKKAQEFKDAFTEGAKLLDQDIITWQEAIENVEDVLGIKLSLRQNDSDTQIKRIY